MNILITNSVPLNGGDEALLRATIESLKKVYPDATINVLCKCVDESRTYLSDISFDWDIEYVRCYPKNIYRRGLHKIRRILWELLRINLNSEISLVFATRDERRVVALYRNADVIISAAGGYFHDFYPIEERLRGLEVGIYFGKPVFILGHSVGPFWKATSKQRIREVFNKVTAISLREEISAKHVQNCGIDMHRTVVTTDMAFLWRNLAPELFRQRNSPVKNISMCFRNWPPRGDKITDIINKAVELCKYLLQEDHRSITFLSTCQGIEGYIDDSAYAFKIIERLPEDMRRRCIVDRERYPPRQLIAEYSKYDAFIGMRLHSAILSMLGGAPAMGLGYEDKTKGIFAQMGLEHYQVDFDSSLENWLNCAMRFLSDIDVIRKRLPLLLDRMCAKASDNIERIETTLSDRRKQDIRRSFKK